jgi:hypothetical protein
MPNGKRAPAFNRVASFRRSTFFDVLLIIIARHGRDADALSVASPLSDVGNKLSPQSAENKINNDARDKQNAHKSTIASACVDKHFRAARFLTYGVREQHLSLVSGAKIVPIG